MKKIVLGIMLCCLPGLALLAQPVIYGLPYSQGFESGLGDWTAIDYNNDSRTWSTTSGGGVPGAGGSTGFVSSSSYAGGVDFAPDDFLISPRIAVDSPAVLTWWHRVANAAYPADHYSVYISTTGGTVADFLATTPVFSVTPTDLEYGIWLKQTVDLSAYVGDTISVAFRHHDCYGQFSIMIDNVEVVSFSSPWTVGDTVPWSTTFDTPDTGWTFLGRSNGWYIGAPGALNGSGGMYVSGDGGTTNSYDRTAWNSRFHWAARPLHFADSGDYRVDYDWKCDGYYNSSIDTYFDHIRVMLAPVYAELDTALFFGYGISHTTNNWVPNGWISLSDTNGRHLLAGESGWTHHAQGFAVPAAGDYLLLVLSANGNSYSASNNTPAAIDNLSLSAISCRNTLDTLRLTAGDNQGLTVGWDDTAASQWAVYVGDSLCGTTANTSYYIADPALAAATSQSTFPVIGVSPVCTAGDTALPRILDARWNGYGENGTTVTCEPFALPYSEDFESYPCGVGEQLGWYHPQGPAFSVRTDSVPAGLPAHSPRILRLPAISGYHSHIVTPRFNAPGNGLMVSFWALIEGRADHRDTLTCLHVGTYDYDSTFTQLLTVRGGESPSQWRQYVFVTDSFTDSAMVGISFEFTSTLSSPTLTCYIDDVEVTMLRGDSVPPRVTISGPSTAVVFLDTVMLTANLIQGDTAGLSFNWHSSLLDTDMVDAGPVVALNYPVVGVDTLTLVASNAFGSDTSTHILTVNDNLTVSIRGASTAYVGDTLTFAATLAGADTAGLVFSWHSSLLNTVWAAAGPAVSLTYPSVGVDTLTLTVHNAHGNHFATKIINVQSCGIVRSFPYSEDFDGYGWPNREPCWIVRTPVGLIDNEWRRTYVGVGGSGVYCMYSNGNSTGRPYDAWLVTPAIELPSTSHGISFDFLLKTQYLAQFSVLVSPTGDPWYDGFTDTIYNIHNDLTPFPGSWTTVSLPLDTYAGRHIRIAFVHHSDLGSLSNVRIDALSIAVNPLPANTVSVASADPTMGTVSGGGSYADSSLATITALPYEGCRFVGWNDGDTANPRQVLVVSDTAFIAYFTRDTLLRTVSVSANVDGVCETYGSGIYADSSMVEIGYSMMDTTTEGGHWNFLGWSDGLWENPRNILVTSDTTLMVLFEWVDDSTEGIGEVESSKMIVEIYPNPAHGDIFVNVSCSATITVLDLTGRIVIPPTPINNTFHIPHASLSPGIYFVRVTTIEGTVVKKLIKK